MIGDIVCGFSDPEIDGLIDKSSEHDAGRYDANILAEQIDYVWEKWGWEGVCYYLLHHILDRIADIAVSELCGLCEDYLSGKIILEDAYTGLLEKILQRTKEDYYIQNLWRTGYDKRDKLLKLTVEYILASLEAGWEACIGFVILDVSSTGRPMVGMRVFNGAIVKSVAKEFKGYRSFSEKEIKDFLMRLGELAKTKMYDVEKVTENRKAKLAEEYKRLRPLLEEAIAEYSNR